MSRKSNPASLYQKAFQNLAKNLRNELIRNEWKILELPPCFTSAEQVGGWKKSAERREEARMLRNKRAARKRIKVIDKMMSVGSRLKQARIKMMKEWMASQQSPSRKK